MDRTGLLYGLAAYVWWGLMPLYFAEVLTVPPLEMLAHRIVWSLVLLVILVTMAGRWSDIRRCFRSRPTLQLLLATTVLLALNWLAYIYSATQRRLVQASLGYFILPLVSIVLGMVFLGERLRGLQWLAVSLATAGVLILIVHGGEVPWIALTIAISFSLYGLLRKRVGVDGLAGLTVETLLLTPLAAGYLLWLAQRGTGQMGQESRQLDGLLLLSGLVTTVPLYCFGEAARRLPMTTLGFFQYLSPSLQLILAVTLLRETFGPVQQASFGLIWTALAVFTIASLRMRSREQATR